MGFKGRDLEDPSGGRTGGQEGRIGGAPLVPKGRQHNGLDGVIAAQDLQQALIKSSRPIAVRRRHEGVVEAKPIEEGAQPRIIVRTEAWIFTKRIAHRGQGLAQIFGQHLLVRHIVRDLAQTVHIVGKSDQLGRQGVVGQSAKGAPNHCGPHHLAKRADMGQARRPIAGLQDHRSVSQDLKPRHGFVRLARLDEEGCELAVGLVRQPRRQHPR